MRYFVLGMVIGLVAAGVLLCLGSFRFSDGNGKEDDARAKAEQLVTYAKTWSTRHDGKHIEELSVLVLYAEDGGRALVDPWGQPYQFRYVSDEQSERERIVIWTVNPKTGQKLGTPKDLVNAMK